MTPKLRRLSIFLLLWALATADRSVRRNELKNGTSARLAKLSSSGLRGEMDMGQQQGSSSSSHVGRQVEVTAGGEPVDPSGRTVWRNWEKTVECFPREIATPSSVEEVSRLVKAHGRVRAVGLGHSYNDFSCSDDLMISMLKLNKVVSLDEAGRTVTVQAGMRTRDLLTHLAARGWTLATFPYFIDQTIGGAVINGAHGSSTRIGSLSMLLRAVKLVTAEGDVRTIREGDGDAMEAARLSVGLLGVMVELTLAVVPDEVVERQLHIVRQESVALDLQRALSDPLSVDELQWWFFPKARMLTRSSIKRLSVDEDEDEGESKGPYLWNHVQVDKKPHWADHHHHKKEEEEKERHASTNETDLNIGRFLSRFYVNRLKDKRGGKLLLDFVSRYMKSEDKQLASGFLLAWHAGVQLLPGRFRFSEALPSQMESTTDALTKVYGTYDQYEFAIPFSRMAPCWSAFLSLLASDPSFTDDFLVAMAVRFVREESAFLSMSYGEPQLYINFDNYDAHRSDRGGWSRSFEALKKLMGSQTCQARLYHFGKASWSSRAGGLWSSGDAEYVKRALGPAWERFDLVRQHMDPHGKFLDHRGLLAVAARRRG